MCVLNPWSLAPRTRHRDVVAPLIKSVQCPAGLAADFLERVDLRIAGRVLPSQGVKLLQAILKRWEDKVQACSARLQEFCGGIGKDGLEKMLRSNDQVTRNKDVFAVGATEVDGALTGLQRLAHSELQIIREALQSLDS
jgi:hypothetical protein